MTKAFLSALRGEECNTCQRSNDLFMSIVILFIVYLFIYLFIYLFYLFIYLFIYLHAIFTDFFLLICSVRSASTGYDSVSGTIWTGKRSVCTFVPVLQWVLTIRYVYQVWCNVGEFHIFIVVVSEP